VLKAVTLLGSTGSIGTSTLDVLRQWPDRFRAFALVAGRNTRVLAEQIVEFRPEVAAVAGSREADSLAAELSELGLARTHWPEILHGAEAYIATATSDRVDIVLSAIVGIAGLEATYEAVRRKKLIALANKETLVAGGSLVMSAAKEQNTELLPVDSEHNGAHQCLRAGRRSDAVKLILTASGGPFRSTPVEKLAFVTPAEALNHPTWKMGQRITIDSATLMNKGFEVIEACWLFDFAPKDVEVVVHPQSQVHAMVEYNDGSVIAQVCATDMRMPIQYALTWPDRASAPVPKLDWSQARYWEFYPPDFAKFPLLKLAYQAQEARDSSGCTLNAADEVAVEAFLQEQIPFTGIAEVVAETLSRVPGRTPRTVGELLEIDRTSRAVARDYVRQRAAVQA
jgi:1-deoxy-D-xylulose-5-phosphate reductoisomerase